MTDHPITPPPELLDEWLKIPEYVKPVQKMAVVTVTTNRLQMLATEAARWGFDQRTAWDAEWLEAQLQKARDQELEACCADIHMIHGQHRADWLRSMRRPKPPSLKEQALEAQQRMWNGGVTREDWELVRRALEQLND